MNQLQTLVSLSAHTTLLTGLPCLLTLLFRMRLSLYWVKSTDGENGTVMRLRAAVTFPTATLTGIKTSPLDLSTCWFLVLGTETRDLRGAAFRLLSHSRGRTIVPLPGCLELIWVLSGESVEEAIRREVAEEVGLEVENLQYSTSQHWPFPNSSLMIACHATAKPGQTEVNSELSLTLWCPLHRPLSALWACV